MQTLIAGNLTMHGLITQLADIGAIAAAVAASSPRSDIVICPPATLIARAAQLADHRIAIGGQDCHSETLRIGFSLRILDRSGVASETTYAGSGLIFRHG